MLLRKRLRKTPQNGFCIFVKDMIDLVEKANGFSKNQRII